MSRTLLPTLAAVVALFAAQPLPAQDTHGPAAGGAAAGAAAHDAPAAKHGAAGEAASGGHDATHGGAGEHPAAGPVPPGNRDAVWPGLVLIGVATMFVLAAVIGPIVRMHAPPAELPPTHSHDEPPGASHHHGSGGTINPEPYHGHASDHGHGHH